MREAVKDEGLGPSQVTLASVVSPVDETSGGEREQELPNGRIRHTASPLCARARQTDHPHVCIKFELVPTATIAIDRAPNKESS